MKLDVRKATGALCNTVTINSDTVVIAIQIHSTELLASPAFFDCMKKLNEGGWG